MKTIKKCRITDLEIQLLLQALPIGVIPKNAVMRLAVYDTLPEDSTEEMEERLRYSVIRSAVRNGLIEKRTFTTRVHNRKHKSIVYCITSAGIDFLARAAADEYPWLADLAALIANRKVSLRNNPNRNANEFYRILATADFELLVRERHKEIKEGYISGATNVAIREILENEFTEDEYDEDTAACTIPEICEGEKQYTLQSVCSQLYCAHHSDGNLIESVLPNQPCDGLFISAKILNQYWDGIEYNNNSKKKKCFHSNAIGVYLCQNDSFMVFRSTKYGFTWNKEAIDSEYRRLRNVEEQFRNYNYSYINDAIILVDGPEQFAEIFINKYKRQRDRAERKIVMGRPFRNVYIVPSDCEGDYQLSWIEFGGQFLDRCWADDICSQVHYGYVEGVPDAELYYCQYDGKAMFFGSSLNATHISELYNHYKEATEKKREYNFSIYCEPWQYEWYAKLFPGVEIYTEDDIPLCADEG